MTERPARAANAQGALEAHWLTLALLTPTLHTLLTLALTLARTVALTLTLQMLKELERRTGRRIRELFQVIAGTSTGGILALAIQVRARVRVRVG